MILKFDLLGVMHDYLQNEKANAARPGEDDPEDSDEEWSALLSKHVQELAEPWADTNVDVGHLGGTKC